MFPRALQVALVAATVMAALGALFGAFRPGRPVVFVATQVRSVVFAVVDLLLSGATAWLTWKYDFKPKSTLPADLVGPSARLS